MELADYEFNAYDHGLNNGASVSNGGPGVNGHANGGFKTEPFDGFPAEFSPPSAPYRPSYDAPYQQQQQQQQPWFNAPAQYGYYPDGPSR